MAVPPVFWRAPGELFLPNMVATDGFIPKETLCDDTSRIAGPGVKVAIKAMEEKSSQLSNSIGGDLSIR